MCSEGVCDGDGYCVSPEFNPCSVHGCGGKECGDECLLGDILGVCNADGECDFDVGSVLDSGQCGILFLTTNSIVFKDTVNYINRNKTRFT